MRNWRSSSSDVGELKVSGKGAQQIARELRAPPLDPRAQFQRHVGSAHTAADCRLPVAFGQLVQFIAPLLAQDVADYFAERVNVLAERGMVGREVTVVAIHDADG